MQTFLLRAIVAVALALALAPPVVAQSTDPPCKNHYILSAPCVPCPADVAIDEPIASGAQGNMTLVAGSEWRYVAGGPSPRWLRSLALMRINPSGDTDPTWGDCGIARIPIWGADDEARAVRVTPDGKIVVLGTTLDPTEYGLRENVLEPHSYIAVIRLNSDGSLDRTFATGGRLVVRIGELIHIPGVHSMEYSINSQVSAMAVLPDGRIVLMYPGGPARGVALIGADGEIEQVYRIGLGGPENVAFQLHATIEFVNDRGDYYHASDPDEAVTLDRSGTWYRTGRGTRELIRVR